MIYLPDFPHDHDEAEAVGDHDGDYFMNSEFANAIRQDVQPYLDVYRAVTMSAVGILAYRSALDGSRRIAVPDFRDEQVRQRYADDHWSPGPARAGSSEPPPSVLGEFEPTAEGRAFAEQIWAESRGSNS
jgi:hypothetical protein